MSVTDSGYSDLYRATVELAVTRAAGLVDKLVVAALEQLHARELATRDLQVRDAMEASATLLRSKQAELRLRYPQLLREAIARPERRAQSMPVDVQFEQLELMDEVQVQQSVSVGRALQLVQMAADATLTDFNALICSALGFKTVQPERNPMRPETYVNALKEALDQTGLPLAMRLEWLGAMGASLGRELGELYSVLSVSLKSGGVALAGYAVSRTPSGMGGVAPADTRQGLQVGAASATLPGVRAGDEAFLTLDKLRRLLAGDLDQRAPASARLASFSRQFSRDFDGDNSLAQAPASEFAGTMPAAFEALAEMKQVEQVVQRLEQRRDGQSTPSSFGGGASVAAVREALRRNAAGMAQALSLEVVTLMVDNMARDVRLLEPVQEVIHSLEPALLRLALVDARFFSDKQHPARELLQEVTHRSLAYPSVESAGFEDFINQLRQGLTPLFGAPIEDSEPFAQALAALRGFWRQELQVQDSEREQVVEILQHAEQRNLLAEKFAREIDAHPDAAQVPPVVLDFLCGPWAQVVAQARLSGGTGSKAADKYQALISALLWSAHPELTRKNIGKLTRLVPLLISTLRDGLDTIHYPPTRTSAFLESLMGLHQLAFRAVQPSPAHSPVSPPVAEPEGGRATSLGARVRLFDDGNPWVAPAEAKASNFVELLDDVPPLERQDDRVNAVPEQATPAGEPLADDLPLGSWVEMMAGDQWVRTQLTWASPHGTLFLFTSVFGNTKSMTRTSRDKLVATGRMRVISGRPLVEGALDAVAQIAMRNSMDITPE